MSFILYHICQYEAQKIISPRSFNTFVLVFFFITFPVFLMKHFPGFCCSKSCFPHQGFWAHLKGTSHSFFSLRVFNGQENVSGRLMLGSIFIRNQCKNQEVSACQCHVLLCADHLLQSQWSESVLFLWKKKTRYPWVALFLGYLKLCQRWDYWKMNKNFDLLWSSV